jgi:putative transposase
MDWLRVDEAERERLRDIGHSSDVVAAERDRVQVVLLAAEGWSSPRIAQHLGCSVKTVRRALKGWRERGEAALFKRLPGPAPDEARRQRIEAALGALLKQGRTRSAGQLSRALEASPSNPAWRRVESGSRSPRAPSR